MHKPTEIFPLNQHTGRGVCTWEGWEGLRKQTSVLFSLLYIILITENVAGGATIIVSLCFTAEKWKLIVV
jgi:hypothetical protein